MDRNVSCIDRAVDLIESLSARRAWIEIDISSIDDLEQSVALRKESVDRNSSGR